MKLIKQLKCISAVAVIAVCCTANVNAQQIKLAIRCKPSQHYLTKLNIDITGQINVPVNTPMADSLQKKGIPPNTNVMVTASATINTTTDTVINGMVPVMMQLNNFVVQPKVNGQPFPAPAGMLNGKKIYAKSSDSDGHFQIDSVSGTRLPDSTLTRINSILGMMMNQSKAMNKTYKLGESFTESVPFVMPMGKMQMPANAVTKITYILKRVSGSKAYFDLKQSTNFNDTKDGMLITVTGSGTGSITYESKKQYASEFQSGTTYSVKSTGPKGNSDIKFTVNTRALTAMEK